VCHAGSPTFRKAQLYLLAVVDHNLFALQATLALDDNPEQIEMCGAIFLLAKLIYGCDLEPQLNCNFSGALWIGPRKDRDSSEVKVRACLFKVKADACWLQLT